MAATWTTEKGWHDSDEEMTLTLDDKGRIKWEEKRTLTCDMEKDCTAPVAMIDQAGFIYCATHGLDRRDWEPCRKLRDWELRRLEKGKPLSRY